MHTSISSSFRPIFTSLLLLASAHAPAEGQELPWPRWWFGLYGGANINLFSGTIASPATTLPDVASPTGFTRGSGLGLVLGAMLEYNSGALLGGNLMLGYDNRSFDAEPVGREQLSVAPAYIAIEPNIRINAGTSGLHALLGPAVAVNVAAGVRYDEADAAGRGVTTTGDLADVRGLVIGGQAGVGYDIALSPIGATTQILATPFAQARLGQGLLDPPDDDDDDLAITSIRLGLQVKFGARQPVAIPGIEPVRGDFDIALRVPEVITENRTLRETFPLRNYIFFDAGSTDLPERYTALAPADAATFREEQLVRPGAEPGGGGPDEIRSRQQMQVYYNVINVLGDRLRRNPAATVRLIGAAGGDADAGRTMAANVRTYLVDRFAIDPKRIAVEGQAMPPNRSGSGSSQGEDAKMIAAENHRVTIVGPDELLRPLNITLVQDEPIGDDVVVSIPSDDEIASWSVEVTRADGTTERYGPFRSTTARLAARPLLGAERDGRFTLRSTITLRDGSTMTSGAKEFRLVRSDAAVEQTGTRFSILFEFDESKTVETYESFLARIVAPSIPNGATVIIHGHTDLIGSPEYNFALAQRRVDETQRILTRELTRAGRTVTFDTYGFGEDERRTPFNNVLPEQRYYNRTVVIEVLPSR